MLRREGIHVGEKRVARLMALAGLQGAHRRRKRGCTIRVPGVEPFPDLVGRDFRPRSARTACGRRTSSRSGPARGGCTSPPSRTSSAVGSSAGAWTAHMRQELVIDALTMAVAARKPDKGTIHHSDHGGQFIGLLFGQTCHDAGIAQSMGAVGTCYDNAVAETFFATLTKESSCTTLRSEAGRPALSCARRSSSTSRGSTTRAGCTARSGCAPPSSTRRTTPPAIPTASRAPAHTRTRAKKLLTTFGCQQQLRQRQPDSIEPGEVHGSKMTDLAGWRLVPACPPAPLSAQAILTYPSHHRRSPGSVTSSRAECPLAWKPEGEPRRRRSPLAAPSPFRKPDAAANRSVPRSCD